MKANTMKRVLAFALSATMIFASAVTVFAADPTTTAGSGEILDYKIQTQVVPTALKVAINPNGYAIDVRYTKLADDATFAAGTKYYKYADNAYSIFAATADNFDANKASLYTATTSTDQIVTFNYGMANKSTVDRKITLKLDVTADENIEFVSTEAAAQNKSTTNTGGAEQGEYKVYLALYPAKAGEAITTSTYEKATAYAANTQYYTRDTDGKYTEATIADETAFKGSTSQLYKAATAIGTEIQASELGDVTMTKSTDPIVFAAGKGTTNANVAYSLPKATYALKSDQFIGFGTSATGLGDKFDMTVIGGTAGFTITGAMNTNTEWTKLTTKTITITPTYKLEDATGLEEAVDTGLNQVVASAMYNELTGHGEWSGANLWLSATSSSGFSSDSQTVEVSDGGTNYTAMASGKYAVNDSGWVSTTWANITEALGGDPSGTVYLRVTDGSNRYTIQNP